MNEWSDGVIDWMDVYTEVNEIWLDAGNNPSLHVNIVPGQGDTKPRLQLVGVLLV